MKLLVVGNMYPPQHLGGYEQSCRDVVRRLVGRGHTVHVLTSDLLLDATAPPNGAADGAVHRRLRVYWHDHQLLVPSRAERWRVERHNRSVLAALLRDVRPDVVSVWNMGAMSTGLLVQLARSGLPAVHMVCDEWPEYAPRVDPWMRAWSTRPVLGRLVAGFSGLATALPPDLDRHAAWLFVSQHTRDRMRARTPYRFEQGDVVYSGVALEEFPRRQRPVSDWSWRLLCVGRVEPRKGFESAIRALALLPPQATLDVVGPADPEHRRHLDAVAAELELSARVNFRALPREQLAQCYAAADSVVFPSTWEEPFGLVPLEAMAVGTPVVATLRGGSAEFCRDGVNCVGVAAGDPESIAAGVRRLADDASLRMRLSERGAATAAELSADRLADVAEQWYVAAAQHFSRGRPSPRHLVSVTP